MFTRLSRGFTDATFTLCNRVPELYATEKDATSATNTYQAVPSDHRFYYFLDRAQAHIPVSAFPEGLKMIVGNISAKTYEDTGLPATALI